MTSEETSDYRFVGFWSLDNSTIISSFWFEGFVLFFIHFCGFLRIIGVFLSNKGNSILPVLTTLDKPIAGLTFSLFIITYLISLDVSLITAFGVSGTNCAVFAVFPLWFPPEFSLLCLFVTFAACKTLWDGLVA